MARLEIGKQGACLVIYMKLLHLRGAAFVLRSSCHRTIKQIVRMQISQASGSSDLPSKSELVARLALDLGQGGPRGSAAADQTDTLAISHEIFHLARTLRAALLSFGAGQ